MSAAGASVDPPAELAPTRPVKTIVLAALRGVLREPAPEDDRLVRFLHDAWMACDGERWPLHWAAARRAPAAGDERIASLVRALQLDDAQALALALAMQAEIDPAIGRAVEWMQASLGGMLPTLGLLAAVVEPLAASADVLPLRQGRAFESGALVAAAHGGTLATTPVQVPALLLDAIAMPARGAQASPSRPGPSVERALGPAITALRQGPGGLVVRCADRDELRLAASWVAHALGRWPLWIDSPSWPPGLAAACALGDGLPVFTIDAGPGERIEIAAACAPEQRALVLTGEDGSVRLHGLAAIEVKLPIPDAGERCERWSANGLAQNDAQRLAQSLRCGAARIDGLADSARLAARGQGRATPSTSEVLEAARADEARRFEGIGRVVDSPIEDERLVLANGTAEDLQRLLAACRVRERLPEAGSGARCGVRALLSGPSGTGKTLAAHWLAHRLGVPLVAIDLAALTSKWVGETEKNLAQVFARAERSCAVLLFDEADSVFGARTEVGSANDRFANNQTNYLLSRIERFDGIVLLTTNNRARIDSGFLRRLDMVIEFAVPGPAQRRGLWAVHLADELDAAARERLASVVDLAGGNVAAAVRAARAQALDARRAVKIEDLRVALRAEYQKLGRSMPAELNSMER